jgi:ribose-phosphate pyrophosphokinase
MCKAVEELKEYGAKKVFAFVTHGLFSGKAPERIANSKLEKIIITNTIPLSDEMKKVAGSKVEQLSVGKYFKMTKRCVTC